MSIELNSVDFKEKIKEDKITMVDFYASWCGPCRMLAPVIEKMASENTNENVSIHKLSIEGDENSVIANEYGVRSIPTILFFRNNEVIGRMGGVQGINALESKLIELSEGVDEDNDKDQD